MRLSGPTCARVRSLGPVSHAIRSTTAACPRNKAQRPGTVGFLAAAVWLCCGGVLLSHNLSVAVPLALPGLASRFGMETGRFPGAMTTTRLGVQHAPPPRCCLVGVWVDRGSYSGCGIVLLVGCFTQRVVGCLFSVGPLVPVGSRAPRGASTSGLSTR